MKCNKEIVFQLIEEVDEICQEKNLRYSVSGEFMIMPLTKRSIRQEAPRAELSMPYCDLCILESELTKRMQNNRAVEWFLNDTILNDVSLAYVATDTTYYDIRYDMNCREHGIRLLIKPIFDEVCFSGISRWLIQKWIRCVRKQKSRYTLRNVINRLNRCLFRRMFTVKVLKKRLYREQRTSMMAELFTWGYNFDKIMKFSTNIWERIEYLNVENHHFAISSSIDDYASVLQGENWRKKNYNKDYLNYVSNSIVPYEIFFRHSNIQLFGENLSKTVTKRKVRLKAYKTVNQVFQDAWIELYNREPRR